MSAGNCTITLVTNVDSKGKLVAKDFLVWLTSYQTQVVTQFTGNQVHQGKSWSPIRRSEQMVNFTIDWPLQIVGTKNPEYNYNGFRAMNEFHNALMFHQKLAATTTHSPPPMNFLYYNNFVGSYVDQNNVVTNITLVSGASNPTGGGNPMIDNNLSSIIDYSSVTNGIYNATSPANAALALQPIQYQGWVQQVTKEYDRFKSVYTESYQMNVLTPMKDTTELPAFIDNKSVNSSDKFFLPTVANVINQGSTWASANISMGNGINISGIPG